MNYIRIRHKKIKPIFNHPEFNRDDILWESVEKELPKYFKTIYLPTCGNLWFLLNILRVREIKSSSLVISDFSRAISETFIQIKKNPIVIKDNVKCIIQDYQPYIARTSEKKINKIIRDESLFFASWFISLCHISYGKMVTFSYHRPTMLYISETINRNTKYKNFKNFVIFDDKNFISFTKILENCICKKTNYSLKSPISGDFIFYDITCVSPKKRVSCLRWYYQFFNYVNKICIDISNLNNMKCKILILTNKLTPIEIIQTLEDFNFTKITLESSVVFYISKRRTGNKVETFQIWKNY